MMLMCLGASELGDGGELGSRLGNRLIDGPMTFLIYFSEVCIITVFENND